MSERVWSTSTRAATGRHVGHIMPLPVAVTELSHWHHDDRHYDYDDAQRSNILTSGSLRGFKLYHCHLKSQTLDSKLGLPILMISYVTWLWKLLARPGRFTLHTPMSFVCSQSNTSMGLLRVSYSPHHTYS